MTEFAEEKVNSEVARTEMGSRARYERFDVNVAFVHGEQEILDTVLGGDREAAGKVREYSVSSEFRRGVNTADGSGE
jgi:hypothetical protein